MAKNSVTAYKEPIYLGVIENIDEVKMRRYGTIMGLGAQYYSFSEQLATCKKNADRDWVLHITWARNGWAVEAREKEESQKKSEMNHPIEYFPKAAAYGAAVEPRHVLDLPADYTEDLVYKRKKTLLEQIQQDSTLDHSAAYYFQTILNTSARYAQNLLSIPDKTSDQYKKLISEFREQLHPERCIHGKKIAFDIIKKNPPHIATQTKYLTAITDLIWYLNGIAAEKEQGIDDQIFVIQDPHLQVYNFLLNYVKKVNPSIKGTLEDPALTISPNMYAYPRASDHFKQEQEKFRHYGIDIRYPGYILAQALLPAQKSHIVFGNLGNGYIFIKLEDTGIAPQTAPQLGAAAIAEQVRKTYPKVMTYLRTSAPAYIKEWAQYYMGPEKDPQKNEEKLPEVIQTGLHIIDKTQLTIEQLQKITQKFIQQGIRGILHEIRNPASPLTAPQKQELATYLYQLQQRGYDHQEVRHDKEVIISEDDITRKYII